MNEVSPYDSDAEEAQQVLETSRQDFNNERPQGSENVVIYQWDYYLAGWKLAIR